MEAGAGLPGGSIRFRLDGAARSVYNRPPVRAAITKIETYLPKTLPDMLRQFGLVFLVYTGYQLVRGLSESSDVLAFVNADRIVDLERSVGLFFEPNLQGAALHHDWIIEIADFMYMNSHFTLTIGFFAWLYLFQNDHFYFVRNVFMVTMALALVGYAFYPTAPPRLFPEYDFQGTLTVYAGIDQDGDAAKLLVNSYAAVPSMHCGFALIVGVTCVSLVKNWVAKIVWTIYPVLVFFVTIVTANHFWLDGFLGAVVVATATAAAALMARARPAAWAFRPVAESTA